SAVAVSGSVDTSGSTVIVSQMPKVDVSGSAVSVSGSSVKVSEMPKVDVSGSAVAVSGSVDTSGSTVIVSQMPKVDVSGSAVAVSGSVDVSTAQRFATQEFSLAANDSLTITGRANRKRLVVQGYSEADETALCRISHNGASANTGAILPCGGGLMGEVEQFHSAAIKVWNPSGQAISIHVMEEY
ncbi:hypothetical protein, partial [Marinomonas posidonica]|uniref:hypothetical protein n=1 Tax=Marinomonas posidonica TaxID=936476 RepID=UPI003735BE34